MYRRHRLGYGIVSSCLDAKAALSMASSVQGHRSVIVVSLIGRTLGMQTSEWQRSRPIETTQWSHVGGPSSNPSSVLGLFSAPVVACRLRAQRVGEGSWLSAS